MTNKRTPVTFTTDGYKYTIYATDKLVEVHVSKGNSGFIGKGKTFHEALRQVKEGMEENSSQ
ncbi:hypothetical protein [Cytobacillus gottheilii]|uniref:hypothetical protein n=1 Tax=Cytobacillus gottheilii TaxID=859144 RepID=UPI0009BB67A7|nr:hypothetical protein [Cytobacillus gottheilii]